MDAARPSLPPPSEAEAEYYELNARRQKSPPRNVCIICSCTPFYSNDRFHIFIVDLNCEADIADTVDGFMPRAPTLRVAGERFDPFAVCVLGLTLYMFESSDQNTTNPAPGRNRVYTYDLSTLMLDDVSTKTSSLKLEKRMLENVPDMLSAKSSPVATPTPDGKLLVFSSLLQFDPEAKIADKIDFELYDPAERSWRKLPGICDILRDHQKHSIRFSIEAFTFLKKSTLLVQTDKVGMFSLNLNLESPDNAWQRLDFFGGAKRIPFGDGRFFVIGDEELCVTRYGAYDLKLEDGFSRLFTTPRSSFGPNYEGISLAVTPLGVDGGDVDNGRISFCQIQTRINKNTSYPHLIMNVYSCNLNKYREDKKEMGDYAHLSRRIDKSFKFLLDTQQCVMYRPLDACFI